MSTLYHYTTPAGFQGILQSKGIWATDTRFLNDRDEFKTGWDVFRDVLAANEARLKQDHQEVYNQISAIIRGIHIMTSHVASFTLNGDMLSQWRGYNGGYGFSLGFSSDALNSAAQSQSFEMAPVVYERADHLKAMQGVFDTLFDILKDGKRPQRQSVLIWWIRVLGAVSIFKNTHFKEEAEYRIFAGVAADTDSIKVRSTARSLIPYLQMQLDAMVPHMAPHSNLGLTEVVVGPAMAANQIPAAEFLLTQYGIDVPVRASSIPYIGA